MSPSTSLQDWLLARLGRGRAARAATVCYLRENGPIAYARALFDGDARAPVEAMLAVDLAWHWKSPARAWTQLTRWSVAALLTDLAGAAGVHRATTLIVGLEAADAPGDISDDMTAGWIRTFASARGGPLHVVVARPSAEEDLVFVAQHPPDPVRALLHGWSIDRDRAERRAYARLRDHSLERIGDRLSGR
jgi:hypothetical protein